MLKYRDFLLCSDFSKMFKYYFNGIKRVAKRGLYRHLSDYDYIRIRYKECFGVYPDLDNPKTYTEKIQWRKLYDRNPLFVLCADKYLVREYVTNRIGEGYLRPLLLVCASYSDIDISILPDAFFLKANHGSGFNEVIIDKENVDWFCMMKKIKSWLDTNYYYVSREWQYKDINPKVLVEKLVLDNGEMPIDYDVFCFHGKAEFIQVIWGRTSLSRKVNSYDKNWKRLNNFSDCMDYYDIQKPKSLDLLLSLAEELSKDFDHVRVDFSLIKDKIYFNELTFTDSSGFSKSNFPEFDDLFGEKWLLK